jgi:hypothetical protein
VFFDIVLAERNWPLLRIAGKEHVARVIDQLDVDAHLLEHLLDENLRVLADFFVGRDVAQLELDAPLGADAVCALGDGADVAAFRARSAGLASVAVDLREVVGLGALAQVGGVVSGSG